MCVCMCMCVCPPLRLLITSGVIWTPCDWLNKLYSFYMAAVVIIVDGCGLTVEAHYIQIRVSYHCISHFFHFNIPLSSCTQATKQSSSVIKVCVVCVGMHVSGRGKEELALAVDKQLQVSY